MVGAVTFVTSSPETRAVAVVALRRSNVVAWPVTTTASSSNHVFVQGHVHVRLCRRDEHVFATETNGAEAEAHIAIRRQDRVPPESSDWASCGLPVTVTVTP